MNMYHSVLYEKQSERYNLVSEISNVHYSSLEDIILFFNNTKR